MQVVLTDDVVGVGDIGETVTVRPGFARNYLIPRGLAMESTTSSARQLAHRMKQIEAKRRRMKKDAEEVAQKVRDLSIIVDVRVASGGRVFGSVSAKDISDRMGAAGFPIDRKRVLLAEPLRKVGTHFVRVKLHLEVEALVKVTLNPLAATAAEEQSETASAKAALDQATAPRDEQDTEE
ncbi:MAG: 50S ribosomal protein L9 [Deltaproteobacteria bacterium]|nr:50S ribosomal protein L9 [Deltaproteobacteria bacterium]